MVKPAIEEFITEINLARTYLIRKEEDFITIKSDWVHSLVTS
jgi:hypothetical protein